MYLECDLLGPLNAFKNALIVNSYALHNLPALNADLKHITGNLSACQSIAKQRRRLIQRCVIPIDMVGFRFMVPLRKISGLRGI